MTPRRIGLLAELLPSSSDGPALPRFFNVAPRDPLTLVLSAGLMLIVSTVAGYLPALRASRVNPIVALRAE